MLIRENLNVQREFHNHYQIINDYSKRLINYCEMFFFDCKTEDWKKGMKEELQ